MFLMTGDVKMVNVGHDHINDFCSTVMGIRLCYSGGESPLELSPIILSALLHIVPVHVGCRCEPEVAFPNQPE